MSDYNRHATPVSRDQRIAGSVTGRHSPSFRAKPAGTYVCVGCQQSTPSPALFCATCLAKP